MDCFAEIAERKIQEAINRGELDRLSLKGQPLPMEDLSAVPEEFRMAYRILKNAGFIPEELQIKQDLLALQDLLDRCQDPEERLMIRRQLQVKELHFNLLRERNARNSAFPGYSSRVRERLGIR